MKKGEVCIFYKDHLPISLKPNITTLSEYLVCELNAGKKRCFITVLYRSPSQSIEEFSQFKKIWEQTMININKHNPYILIFVGDFNAINTNWWDGDINTSQGLDLDEISSYHGLHQIINNPTHILSNSASCIDLLFTCQPNLISESGIHASLFTRCHHQKIYAKLNFKNYFSPHLGLL